MRNGIRDRKVRTALAVSVVLHVLIIAFFLQQKYAVHAVKKGMISVDLIETVRHQSEVSVRKGHSQQQPTFRAPQPEVSPPPSQAATLSPAASVETQAYILAVLKEVNKRKVYPLEALDRGEEGRVVIGVSIGDKGQVMEVRVEEPSAFVRLNQAAVDTVKAIQAFPPLPATVSPPVHLHIPLVYRVESH